MSKNYAKKISVSLPEDIVNFLDENGKNRSKTIVTILQDYKLKKEEKELEKAYEEYSEFYGEELKEWEEITLIDMQGELE